MVRVINIDTKTRTIRVSNGKDDLEWFTTDTGSHVPLKKGQSKAEAIKEHFGDKKAKQQPAKQEPEEKAHRIATNLFSAINTSQFTDAQLKSLISSFIYDEADNLDDDGVVTKDELNSEEFKRLKKFVAEKLAD